MAKLTKRQQECLRLAAQGYTSKEIGRQLGIAPSTVDNHLYAASQTLEVGRRAEAARRFVDQPSEEPRQELPRQPSTLAASDILIEPASAISERGWRAWWIWLRTVLPPVGGKENDLSAAGKLYAIGRIALVSALLFVSCVIVIRMCFKALG